MMEHHCLLGVPDEHPNKQLEQQHRITQMLETTPKSSDGISAQSNATALHQGDKKDKSKGKDKDKGKDPGSGSLLSGHWR